MYRGRIVESGPAAVVLADPAHPYTAALMTASSLAALRATDDADSRPLPVDDLQGCPYRNRCPRRTEVCDDVTPALTELGEGRVARCHHPLVVAASSSPEGVAAP
jgi:oligopeptide/dipeptide ABC transporter ATP-binding protein